ARGSGRGALPAAHPAAVEDDRACPARRRWASGWLSALIDRRIGRLPPVLAGRQTGHLAEAGREIVAVVKATRKGDLGDAVARGPDRALGVADAELDQIVVGRRPGQLAKRPRERAQ